MVVHWVRERQQRVSGRWHRRWASCHGGDRGRHRGGERDDATLVGAALTYEEGGPRIPISLTFAMGSARYRPWPDDVNDDLNPREYTFTDQPAGAPISIAATREAHGPLAAEARWSNGTDTWVWVLRDGDTPLPTQGFGGQSALASFVSLYVDGNGRIDPDDGQAIYLFELGTTAMGPSADFQDVVILVSVRTQAETVGV